jgi:hypothetical protein
MIVSSLPSSKLWYVIVYSYCYYLAMAMLLICPKHLGKDLQVLVILVQINYWRNAYSLFYFASYTVVVISTVLQYL